MLEIIYTNANYDTQDSDTLVYDENKGTLLILPWSCDLVQRAHEDHRRQWESMTQEEKIRYIENKSHEQ